MAADYSEAVDTHDKTKESEREPIEQFLKEHDRNKVADKEQTDDERINTPRKRRRTRKAQKTFAEEQHEYVDSSTNNSVIGEAQGTLFRSASFF